MMPLILKRNKNLAVKMILNEAFDTILNNNFGIKPHPI
jgi:hypothetical protein